MLEKTGIGSSNLVSESGQDARTLDAAAAAWLRSIARVCKLSTCMNYAEIYAKRISPVLGDKDVCAIDQEDLQKVIFENPILHGKKPSPEFAHKTCRELMRILEFSGQGKVCTELMQGFLLPAQKHKSISTFSPKEQRSLTAFLLQDPDSSKLGILFGLLTGCRLGEICALRTRDISLENEVVHICHTVQRIQRPEDLPITEGIVSGSRQGKTMLIMTDPKTENSDRYIPLAKNLLDLLKEHMPDTEYFLNGNEVMDPRTYEYRFQRYQEKAGILPRKFHILRHTFATNCVAGGMSAKVLSEILGHSNVTTTMSLYVHPTLDMKKKQLDDALDTLDILP